MPTAPYPILSDVTEAARIKFNDAVISGGDVFTNTQAFTAPYVNLGYQKFQQFLVSLGYQTLEDETVLGGLPPCSTTDPAVMVRLDWTGYFDGTTLYPALALPQSAIRPLYLWERPTGSAASFNDMDVILNGLDSTQKQNWIIQWEWRADAIYMLGALVSTDLRVRFAKYLADFLPDAVQSFAAQPVPIMRSTDALSGFIAYEMCSGRGDVDAASLLADAKEAAMIIVGLDSMEARSIQKESERGKMKDRYSGGQAA